MCYPAKPPRFVNKSLLSIASTKLRWSLKEFRAWVFGSFLSRRSQREVAGDANSRRDLVPSHPQDNSNDSVIYYYLHETICIM